MFGQSGALKYLLSELERDSIHFDSLESILAFNDNWKTDIKNYKDDVRIALLEEIQQQKVFLEQNIIDYDKIIKKRRQLLLKEKEDVKIRIKKYSEKTNPIKAIYYFIRRKQSVSRQNVLDLSFDKELHRPFKNLAQRIQNKKDEIDYKENNIEEVVEDRSEHYISNFQRIKSELDSQYPLISGAIGEQKAIEELKKLPDDFYVINDLSLSFDPPIFNMRDNDRIHSIQVDHLVISPSGIFLIETKNWSKNSVESLDLFSLI